MKLLKWIFGDKEENRYVFFIKYKKNDDTEYNVKYFFDTYEHFCGFSKAIGEFRHSGGTPIGFKQIISLDNTIDENDAHGYEDYTTIRIGE